FLRRQHHWRDVGAAGKEAIRPPRASPEGRAGPLCFSDAQGAENAETALGQLGMPSPGGGQRLPTPGTRSPQGPPWAHPRRRGGCTRRGRRGGGLSRSVCAGVIV